MNPTATCLLMVIAGYLIGAVPFGLLVGRWRGIDVRKDGSGNIGATNVGRLLGVRWGLLVFALDVSKGLIPVLVAGRVLFAMPAASADPAPWWLYPTWLMTGLACVLGHVFPIHLRLRGGKGVATCLGVVLGVWPMFTLPGLIAFVVFVVTVLITRYVAVGSIAAVAVFPVAYLGLRHLSDWPAASDRYLLPFAIVLPVLVIWRHRANLQRLWAGTENRIGRK